MRRRIYGLLAAACLILAVTPAVRAADTVNYAVTGGNIYFDKSTGTVTGCDASVTEAEIPKTIDGVRVTSIGEDAFYCCYGLTSVSIPDSVTSIDNGAFRNSGLTSVSIPNSVTSIGSCAFEVCRSLTSVSISNGVIGKNVFYCCYGLTSVSIANGVTSIGSSAFQATGLTSVSIPKSVTSIGNQAFASCRSLTSVSIANGVTSIGNAAFSDCGGLTDVHFNGTQAEYETNLRPNIVNNGNDRFLNATFHFKGDASPNPTLPNTAASDYTAFHGTIFLVLAVLTLTVWALGRRKRDKQSN